MIGSHPELPAAAAAAARPTVRGVDSHDHHHQPAPTFPLSIASSFLHFSIFSIFEHCEQYFADVPPPSRRSFEERKQLEVESCMRNHPTNHFCHQCSDCCSQSERRADKMWPHCDKHNFLTPSGYTWCIPKSFYRRSHWQIRSEINWKQKTNNMMELYPTYAPWRRC